MSESARLADDLAHEYTQCRLNGYAADRLAYWYAARRTYSKEVYMILLERVKEVGDVDRMRRELLAP